MPLEYQARVREEEQLLLDARKSPGPPDEAEASALRQKAARRVVCDYVAGMTDRYAQEDYRKLFTPGEKV